MERWARIVFQPNLPLEGERRVTASKEHIALSKQAAAEGMVLLKNEKKLLPLAKGARVALFGKGSLDYVKGGGGSGDVYTAYVRNLYDGMKQVGCVEMYEPLTEYYRQYVSKEYEKGTAPGMIAEPELRDDLLKGAKAFTNTAIISISRFSGEGQDRIPVEFEGDYNPWETEADLLDSSEKNFPDGDFCLTEKEKAMVAKVEQTFDNIIVVLNVGGVVDTTWIKDNEKISAALLSWQGGMEGGTAAAEVLCGIVNPSGKLPDTFASSLDDYPSTENFHESVNYVDYTEDIFVGYRYFETFEEASQKVCYPFGYGLSYTEFEITPKRAWEESGNVRLLVQVTNIGEMEGKEVVQVYYSAPQGRLGKAKRELAAFAKTRNLLPGESQTVSFTFKKTDMASYDDLGKIVKSAYILEKGTYEIYVGNSVRNTQKLDFAVTVDEDTVAGQMYPRLVPTSLKKRLLADGSYEELVQSEPNDPNESVIEKMKNGEEEALTPVTRARDRYLLVNPYQKGAKPFCEVAEGKFGMEEFLAQLSDENLIDLLGGQPNTGVGNVYGYGNLPEYGVPNIMTADGPAGVRLHAACGIHTTAWPCATLLASTWNTNLVERVGEAGAKEVKENNLAVWLTPAVNIHRNPLCGRNFEYYSEDPYLTGKMGAAAVRGIQSQHIGAAVKHFACNNKETNRKHSDSRVSERALREIYLKGFEIIVKEADPWVIMSAYNIVNGQRASESHELLTDILRGEWGFGGMVTSDWWTRGEHYKEIKAGNDVKMATGFTERVLKAMELGAISRADLEICARRVLELILKID